MKEIHARHMAHVALLLRLLDVQRSRGEAFGSMASTPELFLVRDEGESFWELVGFRTRGFGGVLLGALRFPRQPDRFQPFARRALDHYLSSPPKEIGISATPRPAGLLEVAMPEPGEDVPAFQRRMASGVPSRKMFLDSDLIEFAFDFRTADPTVAGPGVRPATETHIFRTVRGHVLSGTSPGLHVKLHQGAQFLPIRDVSQHTQRGADGLPPLVVHRAFLTLDVRLGAGETVADLLTRVVPILPESAEPRSLLIPDA